MALGTLIGAGLGGAGGFFLGGPMGAAAGAQLGGAIGGSLNSEFDRKTSLDQKQFNLPQYNQQYGQYSRIAGADPRTAPQAGLSDFRRNQQNLVGMLQNQAVGRGPGQQLVRMQAQGMADRGAAQQMAMARGARPGMGVASMLGAAQNAANIQSHVGGQAAQAGLQAQLGAIGQLQGTLEGARGADELQGRFNADARLRQMGLDDQRQMEALRQRLAASQMQQQGQMGYQNARLGAQMSQPTMGERIMGGLGGAGQMMGMMGLQSGGGARPAGLTPDQVNAGLGDYSSYFTNRPQSY